MRRKYEEGQTGENHDEDVAGVILNIWKFSLKKQQNDRVGPTKKKRRLNMLIIILRPSNKRIQDQPRAANIRSVLVYTITAIGGEATGYDQHAAVRLSMNYSGCSSSS